MQKCKNGGNCELNQGRKTCKECRYRKCLAVGMEPEKLLYGEEREKYSHPKKRKKQNGQSPEGTPSQGNNQATVDTPPKRVRLDPSLLIDNIQKSFTETISEYSHNKVDINMLVSGHLDPPKWSSTHSRAFVNVMESNLSFMKHFAYKNSNFMSLRASDRVRLLQNNDKLFREYVTTRYLCSEAGMDQLEWIFGLYETVGILDFENVQAVGFDLINQHGIIASNLNVSSIANFKYCLEVIKKHFQYPHYHTALICNFILFNTQCWNAEDLKDLAEPQKIGDFEDEARKLIKYGCEEISSMIGISYLDQLIQTLSTMTSLKNKSLAVTKTVSSRHFSQHEKQWIGHALALFEQSILAVPADAKYVEMCLDFNSGAFHEAHQYLFQSNNLAAKRTEHFFKTVFGSDYIVPPQTLVRSNLIVAAYAGKLTKLSEAMWFYSGRKHHGELEKRIVNKPNRPWIHNRGIQKLIAYEEMQEYNRVMKSVTSFLHDFEMLWLTFIDSLVIGSTEHAALSVALRKLVLKKIANSCVLETTKHPYEIYQQFLMDAQKMGAIQQKVIMLALMNPELKD